MDTESPRELEEAYQLYMRHYRPKLVIGSDEYVTRLKAFKKSVEDAQITHKNFQEGRINQKWGVNCFADRTKEEMTPRKWTKEKTQRFFGLPEGFKFEVRKPPPPDKYFCKLVKDVDSNNRAEVERAFKEYNDIHCYEYDYKSDRYERHLESFAEDIIEAQQMTSGRAKGLEKH